MHPAMVGLLAGLAVAAFFVISEYMIVNAAAAEQGKKLKKKPVLDETQKKRLKAIWSFVIFIPPAFALAGWVLLPLAGYTR